MLLLSTPVRWPWGDRGGERGQGTVEWVGLLAVVALLLVGLIAAGARVPGAALARELGSKLLCAAALADGCGDEPALISAYGTEVGGLVREQMPSIAFERGSRALPVDFRRCRRPACGDGTARGLVGETDAGLPVTAFVHVIDCRGTGNEFDAELSPLDAGSDAELLQPEDGWGSGADRGEPGGTPRPAAPDRGQPDGVPRPTAPDRGEPGGASLPGAPDCSGERAGNLYIQYWLYYADSATLRGVPIAGAAGYHRDDWESVQIRIGPDGRVDERASSHHGYNHSPGLANAGSDAGIDSLTGIAQTLGVRPRNGWGPQHGLLRVSGGSHAGNASGYLDLDRIAPAGRIRLVPLESVAAAADGYRFAVSPPWHKRVWRDPESGGTE